MPRIVQRILFRPCLALTQLGRTKRKGHRPRLVGFGQVSIRDLWRNTKDCICLQAPFRSIVNGESCDSEHGQTLMICGSLVILKVLEHGLAIIGRLLQVSTLESTWTMAHLQRILLPGEVQQVPAELIILHLVASETLHFFLVQYQYCQILQISWSEAWLEWTIQTSFPPMCNK